MHIKQMTKPIEGEKYVVMINYGSEGWKIHGETYDFQEAFIMREQALGNGNSEVRIFKSVKFEVREIK